MPTTKKPPLPIGTPVAINIAQRMSLAKGTITEAEYDDGWMYRIDVTDGDDCRPHRNRDGQLWVCDFEVTPVGDVVPTENHDPLPHSIELCDDLMCVMDEDGNGYDCHELKSLRAAKRQLRRWQDEYTFNYAEAINALSEHFDNL